VKRYLYIGILGCLVAVGAIILTYWQSEDHVPDSRLAASGSAQDTQVSRSARSTGIPVPVPPPVAAFRTDSGGPGTSPVSDAPTAGRNQANAGMASPVPESRATAAPDSKEGPLQGKPDSAAGEISMPVFDVVRVNPEGDALIAGRAPVGAEVGIYDGNRQAGKVVADSRGEWVFLPGEPLPSGQREISLSLIAKDGTETRSGSVVILVVPERDMAKTPPAAATPADGKENKSEGVLAVLVSREGAEPSRVLQKPSEAKGLGDKALSIDVIDYDDQGNVNIGGKATPGIMVQVYVDNKPAAQDVRAAPDGHWQVKPDRHIDTGVRTLRVDGLSDGKVVARVEMPFSRAQPPSAESPASGLVVVQPGNSLWRIARRTLGDATRYTEIYEANRSKIVNPDLIYPGQLFSLPAAN
jgi:hypothetical protein